MTRQKYIKNDFIKRFPYLILDSKKGDSKYSIVKTLNVSLVNILKILHVLRDRNVARYTDLLDESEIKMKATFLMYMHFCVDCNLIIKQNDVYKITKKGLHLYDSFRGDQ